ncbi:MAG: DUF92 domain-containing protein [Chloroflexia bacterium]
MIFLGFLAAGLIAYLAYRARALTPDGAVAACLVGGAVFGFGGLGWAVLLVFFFASSSVLSFVKASDVRKRRAAETFEKGGRRDAAQVLANGGVAALLAVAYRLAPSQGAVFFAAFLGALGAATADTWATEIGVLSRRPPRLITTGKPVAAGASGGVTWLGSVTGAAGALCLGLLAAGLLRLPGLFDPDDLLRITHCVSLDCQAWVLAPSALPPLRNTQYAIPALAALLGGLVGSLTDSFLGATVQASYRCPACDKLTESTVHRCGTPTQLVKGSPRVNNDLVNLLATLAGAVMGGAVEWALSF